MKIKLISIDVDGTITDKDGIINTKAIDSLRKIVSLGIPVFLNTGRSVWENYTLSHFLGFSRFGISENGGVIFYDEPTRVAVLGEISDAYQAYAVLTKELDGVIINQRMPRLTEIILERNIDLDKASKILQKYNTNAKIVDSGYAYHLSSAHINKGYALKSLCKMLNVKLDAVASIGDSAVDIPMLATSGVSFWVAKNTKLLRDGGLNDRVVVSPEPGPQGVIYAADWLIKNDKLSV
ncbi:MAG: phosphoglycolate phosphatase [Conexivisphaerales archaeon]